MCESSTSGVSIVSAILCVRVCLLKKCGTVATHLCAYVLCMYVLMQIL